MRMSEKHLEVTNQSILYEEGLDSVLELQKFLAILLKNPYLTIYDQKEACIVKYRMDGAESFTVLQALVERQIIDKSTLEKYKDKPQQNLEFLCRRLAAAAIALTFVVLRQGELTVKFKFKPVKLSHELKSILPY